MRSLRGRSLLTASLVLVTFLGCAGVLLDRAFQDSAMKGVEDRLRGRIFMLIGAANFDADRASPMIGALPDPSLSIPGSGHYARIFAEKPPAVWSSRSLLAIEISPPATVSAGEWRLGRVQTANAERLFELSYGIIWEGVGDREPRAFAIQSFETESLYRDTVSRFRQSLWSWFAGLSVALLLVQALNLNRGLRPLVSVGEEVRAIEHGEREQIVGTYPLELTTLTRNLNKLLKHNRESLKRYRNSLGDLAHAIKTPLTVLRNEVDALPPGEMPREAEVQIDRIDRTVQYYLQRSATAGRSLMAPAITLAPIVDRIAASLRKVHAQRQLAIRCAVDSQISFAADEGDLMEIIGNLADNACKWARKDVSIEITESEREGADGLRLVIAVHDDGAGIPTGQLELLTQRGTRLDESIEGHGIGLAIVRDMVEDVYGGRLTIESDQYGTLARAELNSV